MRALLVLALVLPACARSAPVHTVAECTRILAYAPAGDSYDPLNDPGALAACRGGTLASYLEEAERDQ